MLNDFTIFCCLLQIKVLSSLEDLSQIRDRNLPQGIKNPPDRPSCLYSLVPVNGADCPVRENLGMFSPLLLVGIKLDVVR